MAPEQCSLRVGRWAVLGLAGLSLICAHDGQPSVVTPSPSPFLTALAPASGSVGTQVAVSGGGFTPTRNTIKFGAGYITDLRSSDGVTLVFTVPEGLNLCPPPVGQSPVTPCPGAYPRVTPGSYSISVMNMNGSSSSLTFIVTGQ